MLTQPAWLTSCEVGVALALCSVFGLDPESKDAIDFIRYTRHSGQNNAEGNYDQDMAYITVDPVDDPASGWTWNEYDNGRLRQGKTISLNVTVTFYGAHATELAEQAWSGLMVDAGAGTPRFILRDRCLVIVPRTPRPVSLPEVLGGVRRDRSDLRIRMNLLKVDEYVFEPITEVPDVNVKGSWQPIVLPAMLPYILGGGRYVKGLGGVTNG